MNFDIHYNLLVSPVVLLGLAAFAAGLCAAGIFMRVRAAFLRCILFAALLLALTDPAVIETLKDPVNSTLIVVADRSASAKLGQRQDMVERALKTLEKEALAQKNLTLKVVNSKDNAQDGTQMFSELSEVLGTVPRAQVAGVIMVSDGLIHDIPPDLASLKGLEPVHLLVAAGAGEHDRAVRIVAAPSYGLVNQPVSFKIRVEDNVPAGSAELSVVKDGTVIDQITVDTNTDVTLDYPVDHAGENLFVFKVAATEGELTGANNQAFVKVNGIRDRLKVLLVSGAPHPGERMWRNLLKSDPAVDLVHFTILRSPDKFDMVPADELALIAFPVEELFESKIGEFDLIIFDRYQYLSVLQPSYQDNIINFVNKGGALLVASGPEYLSPLTSLYDTKLGDILPARPAGHDAAEGLYAPTLTESGARHPITSGLNKNGTWGNWLRILPTEVQGKTVVMKGLNDNPLLVLDHVGEGRVAQLLSDHIWLWARGHDGGGPHAELLKRLSHWLMKEPDLDEDRLDANYQGGKITIRKRSLTPGAQVASVTSPDQVVAQVQLEDKGGEGWLEGSLAVTAEGLYTVSDGSKTVPVMVGLAETPELKEVIATDHLFAPVAKATNGSIKWLAEEPDFRLHLKPGAVRSSSSGRGVIAVKDTQSYTVKSLTDTPLIPPGWALALLLGILIGVWVREARNK